MSGFVLDSLQQPVVQASVILSPDNRVYHTDRQGHFLFDKLYAGTYHIMTRALGYQDSTWTVDLESTTRNLNLIVRHEEQQIEAVEVYGQGGAVDNLIKAENAAMPVKVITQRDIELMGSRRLDEVLKEQTGVAVVNDIAAGSRAVGVQIQGFSSAYVMVLVDGQPMLGRNSGNFDLSRISVTNIERIEIIKGATSCLYGSDALGGAINIITKHGAIAPQLHASLLYGSLHIVDATLEGETPFANQRGSVVVSGNYYRTDGFNTNSKYMSDGTTVPPYSNYSVQGRSRYRTSKEGTIGITARYAARQSTMVNDWSNNIVNEDRQQDQDFNLSASYDHRFHSGLRSMSRYYYTRYQTHITAEWIHQNALIGVEKFGQQVHRLEQQFAYSPKENLKLTGGVGGSIETMDDTNLDSKHGLQTAFAYVQKEWKPIDPIRTTIGLRYDYTNVYHGQFSPSLGVQYFASPTLTLKAGSGMGFKAPDYKMRYQVFYNPAANYMVVGTDRVRDVIEAMENTGELSSRNAYMLNLAAGNLKAESSWSNNLGLDWIPTPKIRSEFSIFYHRISDQIHSIGVGQGTQIGQIYTYRNLPKAVNKGFELSTSYQLTKNLELTMGYQFLIAKDLSVLDSIRAGNYPYNKLIINPTTGDSWSPTVNDYWGIEDRSRHMVNLKALYEYKPWNMTFNVRANIRGRYPFQETTTNQFIDKYDAFVPDHTLLNLTVEKRLWKNKLILRLIADNILDFTHEYMPGQPGRIILGGLSYRWFKE
ncbi:TonB-dependent receptor [Sphingobacterium sp. SGG-5]|uniref:TonB-dependent receptor n=1 Tax=Sphingobacterium sp. SGG-5 TaxID=2710881 RepID=UPI00293BC0DF|nr:TonB-dependent receptor [Sphingobacterium sp. SGG-5]